MQQILIFFTQQGELFTVTHAERSYVSHNHIFHLNSNSNVRIANVILTLSKLERTNQ